MDFQKFLEKTARELDREVGKILEEQLKEAGKTDKKLVPLLKVFTESCQGGKRIRGSLVALGYQLARHLPGEQRRHLEGEEAIFKVAAAYEIMHTAILVHDDIIDKSLLRRDRPSLHQALGGNHYGISQAISLGDYGFFLAFKIIAEASFPQDDKIQALKLFSKVMMDTTWGEMLDLEKTDPLTIMKLKTARYSVAGPLELGAVLAGAGEKLLGRLGRLGENLGIAFQIRDDILDSETDYLGGIDSAEKEMEKYKNKAMKIVPEITKDKKMSKILKQLGEYLVKRKK